MADAKHTPGLRSVAAHPARVNGERRWHFISPTGSRSLRTWASKRAAVMAGEREWQWVR